MRLTIHNFFLAGIMVLTTFNSCKKEDDPVANFSMNLNSGYEGEIIFINSSTGATSYEWDFGDGNKSTQQSPSHTYAKNGTYVVTLTAKTKKGKTNNHSGTVKIEDVKGQIMFWINANPGSVIDVTVNGVSWGSITKYYSGANPTECGTDGCVTVSKKEGIYSYKCTSGSKVWQSTDTWESGVCKKILLAQ